MSVPLYGVRDGVATITATKRAVYRGLRMDLRTHLDLISSHSEHRREREMEAS